MEGDRAVVHSLAEYTTTDGQRLRFDQFAVHRWRGERIVHERLVYDTVSLAAE